MNPIIKIHLAGSPYRSLFTVMLRILQTWAFCLSALGGGLTPLFLSGCGPSEQRLKMAELESSQSEALLRHLYSTCPAKTETKFASLMLTEFQQEPTQAFRDRFQDLGPKILRQRDVSAVRLADVTRIVTKESQGIQGRELVLLLQVTSISKNTDGSLSAVGAWAFKDSMKRSEFRLVSKSDKGKDWQQWEITEGKVLEEKSENVAVGLPLVETPPPPAAPTTGAPNTSETTATSSQSPAASPAAPPPAVAPELPAVK